MCDVSQACDRESWVGSDGMLPGAEGTRLIGEGGVAAGWKRQTNDSVVSLYSPENTRSWRAGMNRH